MTYRKFIEFLKFNNPEIIVNLTNGDFTLNEWHRNLDMQKSLDDTMLKCKISLSFND